MNEVTGAAQNPQTPVSDRLNSALAKSSECASQLHHEANTLLSQVISLRNHVLGDEPSSVRANPGADEDAAPRPGLIGGYLDEVSAFTATQVETVDLIMAAKGVLDQIAVGLGQD